MATFRKLETGLAAWRPGITGRRRGQRNEDHRHLALQGKLPLSTDGSHLGGMKPQLHREPSEAHGCSLQVCQRGLPCLVSQFTVYRLLAPIPSHLFKNSKGSRNFHLFPALSSTPIFLGPPHPSNLFFISPFPVAPRHFTSFKTQLSTLLTPNTSLTLSGKPCALIAQLFLFR